MATLQKLIESEIADFFAGFGSPGEPESVEDMQSQLLARIAPLIASMGQEPVAYMQINGDEVEYNGHNEFSGGGKGVPLYAAPQLPQPVPDSVANTFIAAIEKEQDRLHGEDYLMDSRDCIDVIREELQRLNACRAACYISCRYL